MAALTCDLCGGKLVMGAGGIATCDDCGMEHSSERMKEKVQELKGTVQGNKETTVRTDNTHNIDNYLEMAQNAYNSNNQSETELYCNKVLEVEPTNYKALMLKGKAAGWQSTLQNPRIPEAVSSFSRAIENAPEDEKKELIEDAKSEITNLSRSMLALRGERFAKWPDEEEKNGFVSDLASILAAVVQFVNQGGVLIPITEIMEPAATIINQYVVKAYQSVIRPDYKSDSDPWPNDNDFIRFINRIGYCTDLVEKAINICDEDDEADIQRYENLIFLHKEAIEASSFDYEYVDLSDQWTVNQYANKPGLFPVPRQNRVYYKKSVLNDSAVAQRKNLISKYESKVKILKANEARKRFDAYWAKNEEKKARLLSEKESIKNQISSLNAKLKERIEEINKKISEIPGETEVSSLKKEIKKLKKNKEELGILKLKERKEVQDQIDQLTSEKNVIENRMSSEKEALETEIAKEKSKIQKLTQPLLDREKAITAELTKER